MLLFCLFLILFVSVGLSLFFNFLLYYRVKKLETIANFKPFDLEKIFYAIKGD